jgi:L-threonylcarbamoyladenylate synthase
VTGGLSMTVSEQVENGIAILRQGGLVAYPTDTVYGLGASAAVPGAVERVYRVKERPRNMPLPLLLADTSQIENIAGEISSTAQRLIDRFLPGALTLVLEASSSVPDILRGEGGTVAVRVPAHPVPVALVRGIGAPLVGTSANLSGRPSPLTAAEVTAQLGDRIELVIDGGRCPGGKESTIVDVTRERPVILREGAITAAEIGEITGALSG